MDLNEVTTEDYERALDAIESLCDRTTFSGRITVVYVSGSVGRGDYTPGRSDLDLAVLLTERDSAFEEVFLTEIDRIIDQFLPELVGISPTPIDVTFAEKGAVLEGERTIRDAFYHRQLQSTGRLLYGTDLRDDLPTPTAEQLHADSLALHFETRQSVRAVPNQFIRQCFVDVFSTLEVILIGRGTVVSSKEQLIEAAYVEFESEPGTLDQLDTVYGLWTNWINGNFDGENVAELVERYPELMGDLLAFWYGDLAQQFDPERLPSSEGGKPDPIENGS